MESDEPIEDQKVKDTQTSISDPTASNGNWLTRRRARWKGWWSKLKLFFAKLKEVFHTQHRFVVMDSHTYKEKFAFQLSGVNLIIAAGVGSIILVLLTSVIIVFTPLREYIPGYLNSEMIEQTYNNAVVIDSLERRLEFQEWMISNIQDIVDGKDVGSIDQAHLRADSMTATEVKPTTYVHSRSDSLLRIYVEQNDSRYEVRATDKAKQVTFADAQPTAGLFYAPLHGQVVATYDSELRHFGVDVAGAANAPISAIYSGTVIFANFTVETGYVIAVQHPGNVISVYKHCSALIRREGDVVRVGDPLGYLGNSGQLTTGPHLHFELWILGKPVDPAQYVIF